MLATFLSSVFAVALFATAYYLGYQMGSTKHIRQQLTKVRFKQ